MRLLYIVALLLQLRIAAPYQFIGVIDVPKLAGPDPDGLSEAFTPTNHEFSLSKRQLRHDKPT